MKQAKLIFNRVSSFVPYALHVADGRRRYGPINGRGG
jgi:hypothetical protein